jgi:hypothetical protein
MCAGIVKPEDFDVGVSLSPVAPPQASHGLPIGLHWVCHRVHLFSDVTPIALMGKSRWVRLLPYWSLMAYVLESKVLRIESL